MYLTQRVTPTVGTGVHVYILDTGIRTTHNEFVDPVTGRPRAMHAFDAVYGTNSSEDCHGHGTHVAAVVGGAQGRMLPGGCLLLDVTARVMLPV